MDLKQIQYVLTLAEYRNFTKASKALYISQPTLSSYIAKVEDVLGVTLFDRSTTPLTLTYAGEVYIKGAEEILEACKRLEKQLGDISAQKMGRIRLALSSDRAAYMLPRVLPKYRQMYPNVSVRIVSAPSGQLAEMLLDNRADIAIVPDGGRSGQELLQSDIYSEELVLVAGRQLIAEEYLVDGLEHALDICRLEKLPLISLGPEHTIRGFADKLFSDSGIRPNIVMETDSLAAAYRLATAGLGAAIVPRMTLELTRQTRKTPVYSLGACGTAWKIVALQRKDRYAGQIEKDFITATRQVFLAQ